MKMDLFLGPEGFIGLCSAWTIINSLVLIQEDKKDRSDCLAETV